MARVAFVDARTHPQLSDEIARISGARRGRLINVYKALLNSPTLALVWTDLISAGKDAVALDGRTREMVILRVAVLTRGEYIFRAHAPGFAREVGLTDGEVEALFDLKSYDAFGERDRAVLAYVDAMTRDIEVPDAIFDALRPHFDDRRIVEITVLVGVYNMHARVGRALKIDLEPTWDLAAAPWK